jgi:hypothetical protein
VVWSALVPMDVPCAWALPIPVSARGATPNEHHTFSGRLPLRARCHRRGGVRAGSAIVGELASQRRQRTNLVDCVRTNALALKVIDERY